jgi:argininosuccinate lyase
MEDLIIYTSQEFDFLELDDCISTSSSLMPQKKNPDLFELLRAKAGRAFSHVTDLFITIKGLPSTYNKDLQMDKMPLYRGVEGSIQSIKVLTLVLKKIRPNRKNIQKRLNTFLFSTDLVDYLIIKGMPFREAYDVVAEIVSAAQEEGKCLDKLELKKLKVFSELFDADVKDVFDFKKSLQKKKTLGSTHPAMVKDQIKKARTSLKSGKNERRMMLS